MTRAQINRHLLRLREFWVVGKRCRQNEAETRDHHPVDPTHASAVRWCASGAMVKLGVPPSVRCLIQRRLVDKYQTGSITWCNDTKGPAAVYRLLYDE